MKPCFKKSYFSDMTYTVSITTGNRWAADTDLDLFIILFGDLNISKKHLLRQDVSYFHKYNYTTDQITARSMAAGSDGADQSLDNQPEKMQIWRIM